MSYHHHHPPFSFSTPILFPGWSQRGSHPLPVGPAHAPSPSSCPFLRVTTPPSLFPSPLPPPSFFLFPRISAGLTSPDSALPFPPPPSSPRCGAPVLPSRCQRPMGPPIALSIFPPILVTCQPEAVPASSVSVSHPGSGPPVAVDGLAGGTIPLPAGPHLHQVLAVHEHRVRRCAQHLSAALLLAQVAKTEPLSPRAKDRVFHV